MARRSLMNEPDTESEINLSPMIDCIFILLIFFIVTTVFVEEPGVEIIKPDALVDEELEKNSIIIAVSEDNKIIYGGKELGLAGVGALGGKRWRTCFVTSRSTSRRRSTTCSASAACPV